MEWDFTLIGWEFTLAGREFAIVGNGFTFVGNGFLGEMFDFRRFLTGFEGEGNSPRPSVGKRGGKELTPTLSWEERGKGRKFSEA